MPYVYSTLSNDNLYVNYSNALGGDLPHRESEVLIKGGTGVATKHLFTPKGIVTSVTDEQLADLNSNPVFQMHVKNGFIVVESRKKEVEKVVTGMKDKDLSAPKIPSDFEDPKSVKPKTNKKD